MPKTQEMQIKWHEKFFTNPANALTTSRIILSIVVVGLNLTEHHVLALIVFVIAAATDYFDGLVAKHYKGGKYSTDFGKAYDPVADKVMVWSLMILIIAHTWHKHGEGAAAMLILLLAVLAIREFNVARIKVRHYRLTHKVTSAIQSGRVAMVLMCLAVGVLLLPLDDELWQYVPFLVAFGASMYSWSEYRRRYGAKS